MSGVHSGKHTRLSWLARVWSSLIGWLSQAASSRELGIRLDEPRRWGRKKGGKQRDARKMFDLSTRSRFSLSLVFGPWSRRIRSQARNNHRRNRSRNNSSHTSPRLVSYFSKVFNRQVPKQYPSYTMV